MQRLKQKQSLREPEGCRCSHWGDNSALFLGCLKPEQADANGNLCLIIKNNGEKSFEYCFKKTKQGKLEMCHRSATRDSFQPAPADILTCYFDTTLPVLLKWRVLVCDTNERLFFPASFDSLSGS